MDKVVADDYYSISRVTNIDSSGHYVVWDEKTPTKVENSYTSTIKLLNTQSGEIRKFTSGTKIDHSPKFSPDGSRLAFLSTRAEKPQIFVIRLDGGEAEKMTSAKNGVIGYNWSKYGNKIAYTAMVDPNDPDDDSKPDTMFEVERKKAEETEKERLLQDPRVITDLVYRQGTSYNHPDRYAHVYVLDLDTKETRRISDGYYHHSIPQFVSENDVVSTSKREIPRDLSIKSQLVKFKSDDTSEGEIVVEVTSPNASPPVGHSMDLLFLNVMGEGTFAGQNTRWAMYKNNQLTVINEELDRSVEQIKFLHGKIYTRVDDTGKSDVREFDPVTSTFHKIFETASSVIDYTVTETGDVYFTATDDLKIWAVWKWTPNGVELVDDPNKDGLSSKQLVEAEEMWFTNPEGVKFHGWYFDASKVSEVKPGLVLSIHGGPHAMWTNGGTMFHEWQSTVSAGYSVLALNPIGSQGYGQDYSQLIVPAKWGLDDARDLLAAVDQVSERVDTNRLYITGGSYAGFQTANIISRDHRFKAAVAQRGVYNFVNFGFVTDIPLWFGYEMGGTPYEKLTELWDISPLGRAHEIETPLLIIHAENDFRVPISEAESLFTALKLQDKEVVLVRYPRDGHELSRSGEPIHVVDRIKRMLEWFESHP